MACPTCQGSQRYLASQYPTFHCALCGTLVYGSEDDRQVIVPRWITAMRESEGECLRDDRARCAVYLLANREVKHEPK